MPEARKRVCCLACPFLTHKQWDRGATFNARTGCGSPNRELVEKTGPPLNVAEFAGCPCRKGVSRCNIGRVTPVWIVQQVN
jgi:hypothetical protein